MKKDKSNVNEKTSLLNGVIYVINCTYNFSRLSYQSEKQKPGFKNMQTK